VIGTRYHLADTYSVMMQRGTVKPRIHAATSNGRMDGWRPGFFDTGAMAKEAEGFQQAGHCCSAAPDPLSDEAASFQPERLRSYEIRPRTLAVYITADPSRGRSATSDATAIAVVGLASNGSRFLLDGYCHRTSLSARWIALRTMYHKWSRMPGINRVKTGYERYGLQSDVECFEEQQQIERRKGIENAVFAINELNWPREGGHSKREHVERLEPDFRNSRFYLPASVLHEGRICRWRVQDDPEVRGCGEISYEHLQGPTKAQAAALRGGSPDLIVKPIRQRDEDGRAYDLTARFIEEYTQFPAGAHDDLLDAVSRFIDLEPTRPVIVRREDTEPRVFWDS
jgi:hypothetical protein